MLKNKGLDITVSQGDTARFVIDLGGFQLRDTDVIRFSLKPLGGLCGCANIPPLSKAATGLTGNRVYITIPSTITREINPQTLVYDLTVTNTDDVLTLNLPAKFKIIGTAHSMTNLPLDAGKIEIGMNGGAEEPPEISIVVPPDWGRIPDVTDLVKDITGSKGVLTVTKYSGKQSEIEVGGNVNAATNEQVDAAFA